MYTSVENVKLLEYPPLMANVWLNPFQDAPFHPSPKLSYRFRLQIASWATVKFREYEVGALELDEFMVTV